MGGDFSFFPNEGNEPIHIHCQKGSAECKYWLFAEFFDIEPQFEYNMTPRDRREIRKIVFEHFDLIIQEWNTWHPDHP
ncbi:MAG: DUF4160 domain-containing protein [Kiritimatiellae bacterium]|nr:DUF4160 domain-containing protein [Kiritimatiellia bacterium]